MTNTEYDWRTRLQEARWKAGLTQEELALMTGLSTRAISDIERGRTVPRASTVRLMAGSLGMTGAEVEALLLAVRSSSAPRRRGQRRTTVKAACAAARRPPGFAQDP